MRPQFDYGDKVRVIRNVRNDGTFPGMATGDLLVRRGSVGFVRNIGTFLQDQIIYEVHFLEDERVVGCREEELIDAAAHWVPSRYESREYVSAALTLAHQGKVLVQAGERGQILKVWRDDEKGVSYDVIFHDLTLRVPERGLNPLEAPA
ncbi:MAG: nitrogen fixation protein NifZ [Pseudomonadota bacterium]